jgi:hypothetical protein
MSAWKKPSRNTCVKKISTPSRASFGMSMPAARRRSEAFTGMPWMRSMVHHFAVAPLEVRLGDDEQPPVDEVAPQLAGVRRFAQQVELVADGLLELGHHFARAQPPAIGIAADEIGERVEQRHVAGDHAFDVGAQYLDRGLASVGQHREMHLRHGGACDRDGVDRAEDLAVGLAERRIEGRGDLGPRDRAAPRPGASRARA